LRIIAGDAKGRRILSPIGKDTRPTSDRVKESLFNILGSRVLESKVLDLFAGTGNLGLEAISRGAVLSVFIDYNKDSIKIINENIKMLSYQDKCEVYNNNALSALDILSKRGMKFDIIFIDPPYHKDTIPLILKKIEEIDLMDINGIIATEHDIRDNVPDRIENLHMIKSSAYGDTKLSLYIKFLTQSEE
jgi:16S rRNA (guanine(966)-N(2))-methyltransferase RsmD